MVEVVRVEILKVAGGDRMVKDGEWWRVEVR